ncbi:unnamed protein product [Rotaria magnacalcarata]|uniref:Annexin n=1 Tax=Rotaria magnacalcarata TaxID=392030 RepID=A0A815EXE2_9BILA|nr:unnamed protein product [Rotaria magnacalcarata]
MMNRNTKIDHSAYDSQSLNRPTTASAFHSTSVMKYMAPRTLGLNLSSTFQGSLRSFALPGVDSTLLKPTVTANYGLVALVQNAPSSSIISPLRNFDGESIIDENRELSKLNETLSDNVLLCCHYEVHNRAQESQIELLQANSNKNSMTIEKMFQAETETAHQLIEDASRYKSDLNKKLDDIHQATLAHDEHYQQLLAKRNATNKDIFEYQRQLAQNRAESEFLRCRVQQFNDEINFYTLKNNILQAREAKLRYELDEEIFAQQVLHMEFEVLENEKITNEDVHLTSMNDARQTINLSQLTAIEPANNFREQLNYEFRRMRAEYEKKVQGYKEELHRKLELEYHRYRMHKVIPLPSITKEHETNLEQYEHEKKNTEQQIQTIRENNNQIQSQIDTLEKNILSLRTDMEPASNSQRHLEMLKQVIRDREKQLNEAIQLRTKRRQNIENYHEQVQEHSKRPIVYSKEIDQPTISTKQELPYRSDQPTISTKQELPYRSDQPTISTKQELPYRSDQPTIYTKQELTYRSDQPTIFTKQGIPYRNKQQMQSSSATIQLVSPLLPSKMSPTEEIPLEGTLIRYNDFNVEQDCKDLNTSLQITGIDEVGVIRILCNRSVAQRLQIRDRYKNLYGENLSDVFEAVINGNGKRILNILLLSPVEYDCFELRRILQGKKSDENVFIEICLTRSNKQIKAIVDNYSKIFKSSLQDDIIDDQETPSKQIIIALLQGNRPENDNIDEDEVLEDAQQLYQTNSKWRKDGSTFVRLLCNRSTENLKQIFASYQEFSGIDIEDSIQIDKDLELSRTLMTIVRIVRNRARFFAFELKKSLKTSGSNEENLMRIIVSRCEIDMVQIKSEFEKISKRTLLDEIQTDTSGNLKCALIELLRQRNQTVNIDTSSKQLVETPLPVRKPRSTVQWKDPISEKSFVRSPSNRDTSSTNRFDRNNHEKLNTLLQFNTRPAHLSFREGRPKDQRSYHYENNDG